MVEEVVKQEEERNQGEVTIIHIDNRYSSPPVPFKVDMDVKFLGSTLEYIEYSTPSNSDGDYSLKIGLEDFIISITPKTGNYISLHDFQLTPRVIGKKHEVLKCLKEEGLEFFNNGEFYGLKEESLLLTMADVRSILGQFILLLNEGPVSDYGYKDMVAIVQYISRERIVNYLCPSIHELTTNLPKFIDIDGPDPYKPYQTYENKGTVIYTKGCSKVASGLFIKDSKIHYILEDNSDIGNGVYFILNGLDFDTYNYKYFIYIDLKELKPYIGLTKPDNNMPMRQFREELDSKVDILGFCLQHNSERKTIYKEMDFNRVLLELEDETVIDLMDQIEELDKELSYYIKPRLIRAKVLERRRYK